MPIDTTWEEGPRTEAWNELWRRLLAAVFEDDDREEPRDGGEPDETASGDVEE